MEPTWHTYWKNPGDSGIPPSIDWKLPSGWKAGPIEWPTPERIKDGGLVSYAYQHEVLLLTRLTPPPNARQGSTIELKGTASWLICQRGCLPASQPISLRLQIGNDQTNPIWENRLESARSALPQSEQGLKMSATAKNGFITLSIETSEKGEGFQFYPANETIEPAAQQPVTQTAAGFSMQLKLSEFNQSKITRLSGLLIPPKGVRLGDRQGAVVVDIPVETGG